MATEKDDFEKESLAIPKGKKMNRKTEKEKARKAFRMFIRLRDCPDGLGACFTCGKAKKISDGQAGHFCQGSHDSTYFIEYACHFQCVKCNMYLSANLTPYTLKMIDIYGRSCVEELDRLNHTTVDLKADDFHEIYLKYKKKCEELSLT